MSGYPSSFLEIFAQATYRTNHQSIMAKGGNCTIHVLNKLSLRGAEEKERAEEQRAKEIVSRKAVPHLLLLLFGATNCKACAFSR